MLPFLESPKTKTFMREHGMKDFKDVLKCPKCGQVIKPHGWVINVRYKAKMGSHIGALRCLTQISRGQVFLDNEWAIYQRVSKKCDINRPKCLCGCGLLVNSIIKGKWARYFYGHYNTSDEFKTIIRERNNGRLETLRDIMGGMKTIIQADLNKVFASSRDSSRLLRLKLIWRLAG